MKLFVSCLLSLLACHLVHADLQHPEAISVTPTAPTLLVSPTTLTSYTYSLSASFTTPPSLVPPPPLRRADSTTTITLDESTTSVAEPTQSDVFPSSTTATDTGLTTSTTATTTTGFPSLTPASTVPVAATVGLIMPEPWSALYVGVEYTLGFVDAGPRPAEIVGGWLREVVPLLMLPNYTIDVFPSTGVVDPTSNTSLIVPGDTLCGSKTAFDSAYGYPFKFTETGYHMFIINQTFVRPTITNNTCSNPLVSAQSFFATQIISLQPYPTTSPAPVTPTSAYTLWADVVTDIPGSLPMPVTNSTGKQKLAVGLGVAGGVVGLVLIGVTMMVVRSRRRYREEALAFSRLSPSDQAAFLRDNPNSPLNPFRPRAARRHGLTTLPWAQGLGQQGQWYAPVSRWGQRGAVPPAPPGTAAYARWYWDTYAGRGGSGGGGLGGGGGRRWGSSRWGSDGRSWRQTNQPMQGQPQMQMAHTPGQAGPQWGTWTPQGR